MRITTLLASLLVLTACNFADAQEAQTGSIKGSVAVRGVRSPENVLVYVEEVPGEHNPPSESARMDQIKMAFTPSVLPIVVGTSVEFHNNDSLLHNVFWLKSKDGSYTARNLGSWGKGGVKTIVFDKEGSVVLLCNIHPEMEGHIVVLQNRAFALVDEDGFYEITGVPAGQYTVKTWYSQPRKLRSKTAEVTVTAGESTEQDFSLSR